MTNDISIAYHELQASYAQEIATELQILGHSVSAGPRRLGNVPNPAVLRSLIKQTNTLNVILLSKELCREYDQVVSLFAEAIRADQSNIQIVSLDDDWTQFQNDDLAIFKSISYFQAKRPKRPAVDLARALAAAATSSTDVSVSHLTQQRLLHLLRGSYDNLREGVAANEQSGRIAFWEINCAHRSTGENERYIAIQPRASLEATADYIKFHHPTLLSDRSRVFIVRSDPGHELSIRQKEYTEHLFSVQPSNARAIRFETMVGSRRLRPSNTLRLTDDQEFLIPQLWTSMTSGLPIELSTDKLFELCMEPPLNDPQSRIIVLSGAGGGGKTHFVRFLHDRLIAEGRDVFFLSAASINDEQREATISSLYDVYRLACTGDDQSSEIGKDLFDTKYYIDRPVIVVDGLEEIITMMGERFSLSRFYDDCLEKVNGDANGRIIITTRESAVSEQLRQNCLQYSLQLFGESQAIDYFARVFTNDPRRDRIARKIYSEMVEHASAPPLFCNLISGELKKAEDLDRIEQRLAKGEFRTASGVDAFVRTIISRETKLGIEWPPSSTVNALGQLALQSVGGPIAFTSAEAILKDAFGDELHMDVGDAVKNFFFLEYNQNTQSLTFRYDFLRTIFLAKRLVDSISSAEIDLSNDVRMQDLLSRQLTPGSGVQSRIVLEEQLAKSDQFAEIIEMLVQDISRGKLRVKTEKQARTICSNLLFLRLSLEPDTLDAGKNARLLERLYTPTQGQNVLDRVSMLQFGQAPGRVFRFDLRGKILRSGAFAGTPVDEFFLTDPSTRFVKSRFTRCLSANPKKSAPIWRASFDDTCEMDENFAYAKQQFQLGVAASQERKSAELQRFFRLFLAGHNFTRVRRLDTLEAMFTSKIGSGASSYISLLSKHGLIEEAPKSSNEQYQIIPSKRLEVRHFVMDGIRSRAIEQVISDV